MRNAFTSLRYLMFPSFVGLVLALSTPARAAEKTEGHHKGGYVSLSPAGLSAPIAGDGDPTAVYDPGYRLSLGGGYMLPIGPVLLGLGGAFEFTPMNFDGPSGGLKHNIVRLLPDLRVGGTILEKKLFIYGRLAPGLAISSFKIAGTTNTDPGFAMVLAAGAQYMVWKGLYVGSELGPALQFIRGDADADLHALDWSVFAGWNF